MLKSPNNMEEIQLSRLEVNRKSNKPKEKEYNNNKIIIFVMLLRKVLTNKMRLKKFESILYY